MLTISDIKLEFKKANIKLFEGIDSSEEGKEVLFCGDNDLEDFIEYLKMNNIKYAFCDCSEVTEEALINLELITEYEYDFEWRRFKKEAEKYNKLVKQHMECLIYVTIFIIHNGVTFSVVVKNDFEEEIYEDGEDALLNITNEYWNEKELHEIEREQELHIEAEEERTQEKKQKIDKFYKLLEKDKYFNKLTTKDGRILRASELASEVGLNETKTNIIGHLDMFSARKKSKEVKKE